MKSTTTTNTPATATATATNHYEVVVWGPRSALNGQSVASCCSLQEAAATAAAHTVDGAQAQICAPHWGGAYVTTWAEGWTPSAKYFDGVPEDARWLIAALSKSN